jgi:hypothetical protein
MLRGRRIRGSIAWELLGRSNCWRGTGKVPHHIWGRAEDCVKDKLEDGLEICHKRFLEAYQRLQRCFGEGGAHLVPVCCEELGDDVACRTQHTGLNCPTDDR